MARTVGTKDIDGRITADARPGVCLGCDDLYVPRVAETVCSRCLVSILANPDPWLDLLEVDRGRRLSG